MAQQKTMVGAAALVKVDGVVVGMFDSIDYAVNIGTEPIHVLGRYSPAEISTTSYEAINVGCSGFRIIGNGGHVLPKVPKLQDLLNLETIELVVVDRRNLNGAPIARIANCVPNTYSTGYQAKSTSRIRVGYTGTVVEDESGAQGEGGAATLP